MRSCRQLNPVLDLIAGYIMQMKTRRRILSLLHIQKYFCLCVRFND